MPQRDTPGANDAPTPAAAGRSSSDEQLPLAAEARPADRAPDA
ncbi:MAG: hypothetical protein JWL60_29, partial [Gemmatimonadetes bacterium]|nr:hypothetical protein [Gemmatimonadota bacterium]